MDFMSADKELHHRGHGGELNRRKLQNNTYLERLSDDEIGLLLHNTHIARFRRDGSVILNSSGWQTVTTKDRLGYVSGWQVFSGRQVSRAESYWWVLPRGEQRYWDTPSESWVPFFDGIHLHQGSGEVLSPKDEIEAYKERRRPAPTKSTMMKNYLSFILDPDSMATFATDWKVTADKPLIDTATFLKERPHMAARCLLENRHFDMGVAMRAIELDIAVRGELERSAHWEAMEWAQLMSEGKEPKHFRSTLRRLFTYSMEDA